MIDEQKMNTEMHMEGEKCRASDVLDRALKVTALSVESEEGGDRGEDWQKHNILNFLLTSLAYRFSMLHLGDSQ